MMFERRPALPSVVAMLLLGLVACSSSTMKPAMPSVPAQAVGTHTGDATCQPDFTLALSPSSATITSGQSVRLSIELTSLCGLAGNINVGITKSVPQSHGDGVTINQPRYDIPLDANATTVAYITLGATPKTVKTTYTLAIKGKDVSGGCCYGITHLATFELTVM